MQTYIIRSAQVHTRNGGSTPTCDGCNKPDANLHKPKYSKARLCTPCIKSLSK